jgi:HSP20 family protein
MLPSLTNRLLSTDDFFGPSLLDFEGVLLDRDGSFMLPDVNIIENGKDFKIELAAPGFEKKDFKIEVLDGLLNISAEKEEESEKKEINYRRREFAYSSFSRSFTLPENSVTEKIDAKYENGILRLSLPKKEMSVSKPIKEIKIS